MIRAKSDLPGFANEKNQIQRDFRNYFKCKIHSKYIFFLIEKHYKCNEIKENDNAANENGRKIKNTTEELVP